MYNNKDNDILQNEDNFKKKFKYYKSNKEKPSLDDVVTTDFCGDKVSIAAPKTDVDDNPRTKLLGLTNCSTWTTYTFRDHPGLLLIRNPFTTAGQRYWIRKCLQVYSRKPNKRNIDIEMDIQDWWQECFLNSECDRNLLKKLRWTTLGYHHNWDTKIYREDNKTPFPDDLAELTDVVAQYLGYTNYRAEAAIVNYYHMDSTLSAHTDHSEAYLEAPLFSFSFGQSAIFLIGGKDKSLEPSAIKLTSGDILVMSKEARLCYHAVPRILTATASPWNYINKDKISNIKFKDSEVSDYCKYLQSAKDILEFMHNLDNSEWDPFNDYIEQSRINMNVRQVLNEKQLSLRLEV